MAKQSSNVAGTIVLTALTCAATAAAMMFYLRTEEQQRRAKALEAEIVSQASEKEKAQALTAFLAERIGLPANLPGNSLRDQVALDLARNGAEDSYSRQISRLRAQMETEKKRAEANESVVADLRRKIEGMRPTTDAQLTLMRKTVEDKANELLAERKRSLEELSTLEKRVETLQAELNSSQGALIQSKRDRERDQGESTKKITALTATVRGLREREQAEAPDGNIGAEPPAGSVVGVDGSAKLVTLSVGRENGVRVGTTFRIFRPDATGKPDKEVARVEVARLDGRTCRARITQNDVLVPILSGDLAYSALLKSNGIESVALVGKLDFDGDGVDDSEKIRRMVTDQGGRIDMQIDASGRQLGRLTTKTRYLVVDDIQVKDRVTPGTRQMVERVAAIRREATELGVRILSARKFVDEIGYKLDLRVQR